jgi:hypothetical protein
VEAQEHPPAFSYSPDRRTALVLCGTGADGAYHAGVLRALQEAGVKIDVAAGQGIGAAGAALTAIDGASRLWEPDGIWRSPAAAGFYRWNPLLRIAGWMAAALCVILLVPLFVLAVGIAVFLIGFLLSLLGASAGQILMGAYASTLQIAFADENLPTIVPRAAMAALVLLIAVAGAGAWFAHRRAPLKRKADGGWWWRVVAAPFDAAGIRTAIASALWQLIRGAGGLPAQAEATIGRRFAEVLAENLGQPGFRELIVVVADLDARRDVVVSLLREPYAREFVAPRPGRDRRSEVLDLAGVAREHAFDVIAAALTPPLVCEPALIRFAGDSYWRGETHRLCDRPGLIARLLEEVAAAGVTQVIVVTASNPSGGPHRLAPARLDIRSRAGGFLAAAETAALRDALEMARLRFDSVYVIAPVHNAVGPFDVTGAYDAASDRRETLTDVMQHAYADAYRQFIEPVVGASGEQLVSAQDRP